MKNWVKVCLWFIGACLLIGVLCIIVGYKSGGGSQVHQIIKGNVYNDLLDFDVELDWDEEADHLENGASKEYDVKGISDLNLKLGNATVIIKNSEDQKLHIKVNGSARVQTKVEGSELIIETVSQKAVNKNKDLIEISFPSDMKLQEANLKFGAVQITCDSPICAEKTKLELGAGEAHLAKLETKMLDASIGAGQLYIKEGYIEDADLKIGAGSLIYTGDITGDLDLECGMGSAEIFLNSKEEKHNFKYKLAAGSITIGNRTASGGGQANIHNEATSDFRIDCSMGNVSIQFGTEL